MRASTSFAILAFLATAGTTFGAPIPADDNRNYNVNINTPSMARRAPADDNRNYNVDIGTPNFARHFSMDDNRNYNVNVNTPNLARDIPAHNIIAIKADHLASGTVLPSDQQRRHYGALTGDSSSGYNLAEAEISDPQYNEKRQNAPIRVDMDRTASARVGNEDVSDAVSGDNASFRGGNIQGQPPVSNVHADILPNKNVDGREGVVGATANNEKAHALQTPGSDKNLADATLGDSKNSGNLKANLPTDTDQNTAFGLGDSNFLSSIGNANGNSFDPNGLPLASGQGAKFLELSPIAEVISGLFQNGGDSQDGQINQSSQANAQAQSDNDRNSQDANRNTNSNPPPPADAASSAPSSTQEPARPAETSPAPTSTAESNPSAPSETASPSNTPQSDSGSGANSAPPSSDNTNSDDSSNIGPGAFNFARPNNSPIRVSESTPATCQFNECPANIVPCDQITAHGVNDMVDACIQFDQIHLGPSNMTPCPDNLQQGINRVNPATMQSSKLVRMCLADGL